jgi:chalcone isomerase
LTIFITAGVTDMTIETILVKFSAIAMYVEPELAKYTQAWKGKAASEIVEEDSAYFEDFISGTKHPPPFSAVFH